MTWKLINQIIIKNNNSLKHGEFVINNNKTSDPHLIADEFNDYFTKLGPQLANKIPVSNKKFDKYLPHNNLNSAVFLPTNEFEIANITQKLKHNSCPGLVEIPASVVKFASKYMASPLASLINNSMTSGVFPDKLRHAKVTPVYKNGDKMLLSNYRPISVLNVFSKIFEKSMPRD